ncbi:hypothetical protein NDU88_005269 [Pleurodeles waltl]|uniref:Uncharacterized protein n=1 Tax=Pleurodeles waltl TaxID=8319 RepID=A0AAV7TUZ0_PLEWA|nr:hypothetical protein NDU88_005269 [Pleurodeles waltl]
MAALRDLKGTLEPKLDTVTVDVTLLKVDFKKLSDKVTTAKSNIAALQSTNKWLEEQVQYLTKQTEMLTTKLEDQEWRARRNKMQLVGVAEEAEDHSAILYPEYPKT